MGLLDLFRKKPKTVWDLVQENPFFQQQKELFELTSRICEDGVDSDELPNGIGKFGMVATNPIPCKTVFGSTSYLAHLRWSDGKKIEYERLGSTSSPVSPHPIDVYKIRHPDGRVLATIY